MENRNDETRVFTLFRFVIIYTCTHIYFLRNDPRGGQRRRRTNLLRRIQGEDIGLRLFFSELPSRKPHSLLYPPLYYPNSRKVNRRIICALIGVNRRIGRALGSGGFSTVCGFYIVRIYVTYFMWFSIVSICICGIVYIVYICSICICICICGCFCLPSIVD